MGGEGRGNVNNKQTSYLAHVGAELPQSAHRAFPSSCLNLASAVL